ncbi:alpha-(1,3)-fucosyltransferase C-like [Panulirus ornatus]|uniref:alpha-(1,3)-fucosyltransferase C-like n=1 Tax=Panulirus ornatus TaxID=150431 RepID=UPI003A83BE7A
MKQNIKLSVFFGCLVMFMLFVVFLEEQENWLIDPEYVRADDGGRFRSPKVWSYSALKQENYSRRSVTSAGGNGPNDSQSGCGNRSWSGHRLNLYDEFPIAPPVYVGDMPKEFRNTDQGIDPYHAGLKKILVWAEGYGSKTMAFGYGRAPFQAAHCQVDACLLTANSSLVPLQEFDAVIFHFRATEINKMPQVRSSHQRWVFWEIESASYVYQDPARYNAHFNWTMTYRRDSDIAYPYGRVYRVPSPAAPSGEVRNYAAGKTKMAAWFVSNCFTHSKREKLVKFMRRFLQVDVYGKCGPFNCSRDDPAKCYYMLEKDYKFYLSFENSLCKDYVTEKFFSLLKYDVVPVVFGLGGYDHLAPPHSYINVLDFATLEGLVNYLKYLHANDTAYNEYFKWKDRYVVHDGWSARAQSFCELCRKLHQDTTTHVYQDLKQWFVTQGHCKKLDTRTWRRWR